MKKAFASALLLFSIVLFGSPSAQAHEVRIEAGGYKSLNNRFNIPNPGGSRVLVEDRSLSLYARAQGQIQLSEKGFLRLLVAPLQTDYRYVPSSGALFFNGATFPAHSDLEVTYRFNSYRIGYIYRFLNSESLKMQAGGVGKIRQAKITVAGAGIESTYDDLGFVPLLNFGLAWEFTRPWSLRFDIDGLAASQGRAFDGSLEVFYGTDENGSGASAGIRVLEGGADNEKVNTFALFHYAFLAYTLGF